MNSNSKIDEDFQKSFNSYLYKHKSTTKELKRYNNQSKLKKEISFFFKLNKTFTSDKDNTDLIEEFEHSFNSGLNRYNSNNIGELF